MADFLGPEYFRLLVTVSRSWRDPRLMWDVFGECRDHAQAQGKILVLVHGDADGGDQIAKLYGQVTSGCDEEGHPADWEGPCREECKLGHRRKDKRGRDYCPAARMHRNAEMVALGADRAAAFIKDASPGASGAARLAERAGIPTRRYLSD